MKINPKSGIGELLFGMKEKDVKAVYGEPDKKFKDDDNNVIYLYNEYKLRLTFYEEEGQRLGYMMASDPKLELFGEKFIGHIWETVKLHAVKEGIKTFETETFDSVDNHFNEDNWIIFQEEFGEIIKVELGAIINSKDEFDWKFKQ